MNVYRVLIKEPGNDAARWLVAPRMVEASTDASAKKRAASIFKLFDVCVEYYGKARQ